MAEISLEEYVDVQKVLHTIDAGYAAKFCLTGFDPEHETRTHIRPQGAKQPVPLCCDQLKRRFDVDSYRGVWQQRDPWWFTAPFEVYPIPRHIDTVTRTSRLTISVNGQMVR